MEKQVVTYKYRIKDSNHRNYLQRLAGAVNFVWNYCREADMDHLAYTGRHYIIKLGAGYCTPIKGICTALAHRGCQARKIKLNVE